LCARVWRAPAGGTLIEAIANGGGKLPERQVAIKVALPLLGALAQLHGAGIVHRDIKPEHLMIHNGCLRVGDFGAAGCMTAAAAASATQLQHKAAVALQHRAHQQQQKQQQQADAQHAAADSAPGDPQQLDQQAALSQLQSLQQQALQVQADCMADAAPGDAACHAQPQPSTFDKHKRLSDHSQHRLGSQLLAEVDTLAAVASGPLAAPPVVDAMNFRIGSIEYCAPEMLNKPTPAEVFHLVRVCVPCVLAVLACRNALCSWPHHTSRAHAC
jgi:serine/threonine protein kinase